MYKIKDINFKKLLEDFLNNISLTAKFLQYHHRGSCAFPCESCTYNDNRIFENDSKPNIPMHKYCDCYYTNVKTMKVGTISKKGIEAPDVYLKLHGKLPDYYITKEEAIEKYGWNSRRNSIAGKAPGKMIGNVLYENRKQVLPEKKGRIWYECDVDYESGGRTPQRLYYSNDGLMFYSPNHLFGKVEVYLVK